MGRKHFQKSTEDMSKDNNINASLALMTSFFHKISHGSTVDKPISTIEIKFDFQIVRRKNEISRFFQIVDISTQESFESTLSLQRYARPPVLPISLSRTTTRHCIRFRVSFIVEKKILLASWYYTEQKYATFWNLVKNGEQKQFAQTHRY